MITIENKLNSLLERLSEVENKTCAICMDMVEKPVVLECTHVFCSMCIFEWIKTKMYPACPECRTSIVAEKLININERRMKTRQQL